LERLKAEADRNSEATKSGVTSRPQKPGPRVIDQAREDDPDVLEFGHDRTSDDKPH